MKDDLILDIIPIYENEMYPTQGGIFHYKLEKCDNKIKQAYLEHLFIEIKREFCCCQAIIILEKGMVIKVL